MTKAYEFTLFSNIFSIKLNSVININHNIFQLAYLSHGYHDLSSTIHSYH